MKDKIKIAEQIAREVHKGQKRTIGRREDYIEHPKRVASHFSTSESKIVAWLHDVLEDSDLTFQDLLDKEIPHQLALAVDILTKKDGQDYLSYILNIGKFHQAKIIKIADLRDNLEKLPNGSLRDKYLMAIYILENVGGNSS